MTDPEALRRIVAEGRELIARDDDGSLRAPLYRMSKFLSEYGELMLAALEERALSSQPAQWPDKLPCDVMLAPRTIIRAGCAMETLQAAMGQRVKWKADGHTIEPIVVYKDGTAAAWVCKVCGGPILTAGTHASQVGSFQMFHDGTYAHSHCFPAPPSEPKP